LEQQIFDFGIKLEQAEASALKNGKRSIQKLEQQVQY
jgi:hypothetical protein